MADKKDNLISLSGSPIFRHRAPEPGIHPPEHEAQFLPEISEHIEKHLGPIACVFHEIVSESIHLDVHWVPPNPKRRFHTLVTSGMSDAPMAVPDGADVPPLVELHLTLPPAWRIGEDAFKDEATYWPVRLLMSLARLPFQYRTWLGYGHTVPNYDPPEPYAASTKLCGALIFPSPSVPEEFLVLRTDTGDEIFLYAVVPLHHAEMDYKLRLGSDALFERLAAQGISDLVDPGRGSVC